jgi:hypothetical protein
MHCCSRSACKGGVCGAWRAAAELAQSETPTSGRCCRSSFRRRRRCVWPLDGVRCVKDGTTEGS